MHTYSLVDRATGEEVEVDVTTVEQVTGIEITYIDWTIEQDGVFENADWVISKPI